MQEQLENKKRENKILGRILKKLFFPSFLFFCIVNSSGLLLCTNVLMAMQKTYLEFFLLLFNVLFMSSFIKKVCYHYPKITHYHKTQQEITKQQFYLDHQKIFQHIEANKEPFETLKTPITFESSIHYQIQVLKQMKELFLSYQVNQLTGNYPDYKKLKRKNYHEKRRLL